MQSAGEPAADPVGLGLGIAIPIDPHPPPPPNKPGPARPRLQARPRPGPAAGAARPFHKPSSARPLQHPFALLRSFDELPSQPARPSPLSASPIDGIPLDVLDRLRSFPLFAEAPDSFLAEVGACLHPQLCHRNDTIITEGDHAYAMYWLVRGAVRVTSRDEESAFSHLQPGAFFGEIGVLMDVPRTASVVADTRSLLLRLGKQDLHAILPNYPQVERAIRDEAVERLSILNRLKQTTAPAAPPPLQPQPQPGEPDSPAAKDPLSAGASEDPPSTDSDSEGSSPTGRRTTALKRPHTSFAADGSACTAADHPKKNKPSPPYLQQPAATTALTSLAGSASVGVRQLLQDFPLFAGLSADSLHLLGRNAQFRSFPPFTNIITQGDDDKDLYFILQGEVEVLIQQEPDLQPSSEPSEPSLPTPVPGKTEEHLKARLGSGQYFGEVTSISLASTRTATVRSVNQVDCLMITEDLLSSICRRTSSASLKSQIELTAMKRLKNNAQLSSSLALSSSDGDALSDEDDALSDDNDNTKHNDSNDNNDTESDTVMTDSVESTSASPAESSAKSAIPTIAHSMPPFTFPNSRLSQIAPGHSWPAPQLVRASASSVPFNLLARPETNRLSSSPATSEIGARSDTSSSLQVPLAPAHPNDASAGAIPESLLRQIFRATDIQTKLQLCQVSRRWRYILFTDPDLVHKLDLRPLRRKLTNQLLAAVICPFINNRPVFEVNISDCHHIKDPSFLALVRASGPLVRAWRMRSVWDVSGPAILEMVMNCRSLVSVDLSNCRKVNDHLLAYIIGWASPMPVEIQHQQGRQLRRQYQHRQHPVPPQARMPMQVQSQVQSQVQPQAPAQAHNVQPSELPEKTVAEACPLPEPPLSPVGESGPAPLRDLSVTMPSPALSLPESGGKENKPDGSHQALDGSKLPGDQEHSGSQLDGADLVRATSHEESDGEDDEDDDEEDDEEDEDDDDDDDDDEDDELEEGETAGGARQLAVSTFGQPGQPAHFHPQAQPGAMAGLQFLTSVRLSYCKHVTDRTMARLAYHASDRLEELDLTRCTSVTDAGFLQLGKTQFPRLKRVCLADCTYLTDQAILWLVHAAQEVQELDLSFCCALSDVATEVIALGCSKLKRLNMAFCGSAISDLSLKAIGLHLLYLQHLSVRGCIRVTGVGVESVVAGCSAIEVFDISQCRNLHQWLRNGGIERMNLERQSRRFSIGSNGVPVEVGPVGKAGAGREPNGPAKPVMVMMQSPFFGLGGALPDLPPSEPGSPTGSSMDLPPSSFLPIQFILNAGVGWEHWGRF